jgi:ABC-type transport system substrate-binding protein
VSASVYGPQAPGLASGAWDGVRPDPSRVAALLGALERDLGRDLSAGRGPRLLLAVSAGDPAAVAAAVAAEGMLRAAGIAAELQVQDAGVFNGTTVPGGAFDTAVLTFGSGPGLGAASALAALFDPGAAGPGADPGRWGAAASGEGSPAARYAGLMDRLAGTGDEETRALVLRRAEAVLAEDLVLVPLTAGSPAGIAYWPDTVEGVVLGPAGTMGDIGSWRRAP